MPSAMGCLEKMDSKTQERIRSEYETLAKSSIKMGLNCSDPENWLAQHPEIAPMLYGATIYNPNPDLMHLFKSIMIPAGFGDVMERARWFALGR